MDDDPTIAAFALDLQDAAAATPAPAVGASLAAVLDGRAPTAVYPEVVLPGRVRPTRRSLRLRWAVASAAFGIGAGSLGIAGALPGPVQRQVSRMAEVVGVDLPDGRPTTTTIMPPAPPVSVPASTSVPPRPTVSPVEDRPTPTTVPDDPSNRGNHEGRGRGDELGGDQTPSPALDADADDPRDDLDDELDEDRNGPSDAEDELGEDRDEDQDDEKSDEDRSGHGGDDGDEDEGREP